ncbi:glutathione S-transferase C-terminal domain-containing protein isoform X1 [Hydra vulgaris]|uniref:glutathione S-transferase C-terminal domain-containing protein isoform X1 n=1 Tax=Hydra vulgaris TaxID=6087 RepID=UPI000641205B|nr:glutathione S-transferase C-terminal domain-containing protein [Hydra vulgaris]
MTLVLDDSIHCRAAYFISLIVCNELNLNIKYRKDATRCPKFIIAEKYSSYGLSNVSRQIIKNAVSNSCDELQCKEIELLLGYKQNCLKACSAVSKWTMFCEVEFPNAVETFIKNLKSSNYPIDIPVQFLQLEKELNVSKKTPNYIKYFKGKKSSSFAARDGAILTHEEFDSIEDSLIHLFKVHNCMSCICKETTLAESKNHPLLIENSEVCWPYLCGFNLTIIDLLLLSMLLECLAWIPCLSVAKEFFIKLPSIHKWLLRCTSYVYYKNAIEYVHKMWQKTSSNCQKMKFKQYFTYSFAENITHVTFEAKGINPRQMHCTITKNLPLIYDLLETNCISPEIKNLKSQSIEWDKIPTDLNPSQGDLNPERALRKRQQIENMISLITPVLKSGDKVVDFCSGGGHLGIVVAYLRKDCTVFLIENKEESIERAKARIKELRLTNIYLLLSNFEYFDKPFNIGISLHACGSATDLVLDMCIKKKASFIVCPCCYGSIRPTGNIVYPKSKKFSCLTNEQFFLLARSADHTSSDEHTSLNCQNAYYKQGKKGMLFVDHDRVLDAETRASYKTQIYLMTPESCSPKNNILFGFITN